MRKSKRSKRVNLACDHIGDPELFKAVVFAVSMIRTGTAPNIANSRAAGYYHQQTSDVAYYVGQHAARLQSSRRNMRRGADDA